LQNPAAAQKTVSNILDTIEKLRDFSELGASLSAITTVESDYRYLVCGKYIAFYCIEEVFVSVDRIRRDYLRILFDGITDE
jgi:plasmid stabilization system protein ParE